MTSYNGTATGNPAIVAGLVQAANDRGFKIAGEWVNISKFARGVLVPPKGAEVVAELDRAGFARKVDVVGDTPGTNGSQGVYDANLTTLPTRQGNDLLSARIESLRAAVSVVTATTPAELVTVAHVLEVAHEFERWITR